MNIFPSSPAPMYPLNHKPGWKTNITDYESGKEQRNSRWPFPKRTVNLRYKGITQSQIDTLLNFYNGQKGAYEPFWFFMPNKKPDGSWPSYQGEYVGRGNGTATIFELPSKETTGLTVYVNGAPTSVTFLSGGGDAGVDRIEFSTAPANGSVLSADFAGQLRLRTRFLEDEMDVELFVWVLFNTGLNLREVRA